MKQNLSKFYYLQTLRCLVIISLIYFTKQTIDIGSSTLLLSFAAISGVLICGYILVKRIKFKKALFFHSVFFLILVATLSLLPHLLISNLFTDPWFHFLASRITDNLILMSVIYLLCLFGSYLFWTNKITLTLEAIMSSVIFVYLLKSHRNNQLDSPKKLSQLAWELNIEPQHILLGIAALFVMTLSVYLVIAGTRPLFAKERIITTDGQKSWLLGGVTSLILLGLLATYTFYLDKNFLPDMSLSSEGVGQEKEKGKSPLRFNSAVGKTGQPAALVRFESDYQNNPWSPMLYFRESVLSGYNGIEMIIGNKLLDKDVPDVTPGRPFRKGNVELAENREEVKYSVYLLTKHTNIFAIDFPKETLTIKNPDQERFKKVYAALSYAPKFSLSELQYAKVGNPSWNQSTLDYYLRAPGSSSKENIGEMSINLKEPILDSKGEDLRYKYLTHQLTAGYDNPVQKAAAIINYLSKKSLYTLKPGHKITQKGDPVAPYLFSDDMRGYCVHFSHAAVYMMRLAGVPARIGTGYLTDLTYAKDGHILLQYGDRHAWSEIYLDGYGWVVFDVTPENAEEEQNLAPDEKLLEELMSKIDPLEELEFEDPILKEETIKDKFIIKLVDKKIIFYCFAAILLLLLFVKLWLRYAYLLCGNSSKKTRFAYLSFASTMSDLGRFREEGETRFEYAKRLSTELGIDCKKLTQLKESISYSKEESEDLNKEVNQALKVALERQSILKRALAFISPLSFVRWGRW